jgi:hypothetical protein
MPLSPILACSLIVLLLMSACAALTGTSPAPVGTILPNESTPSSTPVSIDTLPPTATSTSIEPLIPITGENVVSMQCQFCVDRATYAVLVFPDFAYFDVISSSPVSCFTANIVNGQRILICRGTQQTSFNLNICSDNTNCLQFSVVLQECPLIQADSALGTSTPATPIFLTAINTLLSRENDNNPGESSSTAQPLTAQPGLPSASPPPAATTAAPPSTSTSAPRPTDEPAPTVAPEPTDEPDPTDPPAPAEPTDEPTDEPGNGGEQGRPTRRPSRTPRP